MTLGAEERAFLQAAFDLYRQAGTWPNLRSVERQLVKQDLDAKQIGRRLSERYGDGIGHTGWQEQVRLPFSALIELDGIDDWFAPLVDALPIMHSIYRGSPDEPRLTSSELRARGWPADRIRRVGQILRDEYALTEGGSWSKNPEEWYVGISPEIRKYSGCTSARDYIARRIEIARADQEAADRAWNDKLHTSFLEHVLDDNTILARNARLSVSKPPRRPEPVEATGDRGVATKGASEISADVTRLIHPRVFAVAQSRLKSDHGADAAEAAFKEINHRVKTHVLKKTGKELDGAGLMYVAFSFEKGEPLIRLADLSSESGRKEQKGYMQLFAGSMLGIRNPNAHANLQVSRERALHLLVLASLLMSRLDEAGVEAA